MNKLKITALLLVSLGVMIFTQSCEKEGNQKGCGKVNISSANSRESHNNDQNCMKCHSDGGEGKGCFTVAGTAYKSNKSSSASTGQIQLYTEANGGGTLVHSVAIDALGNFHTTESVDMAGLFPAISLGGTVHYMSTSPGSGACNSCHGVSTDKLWGE